MTVNEIDIGNALVYLADDPYERGKQTFRVYVKIDSNNTFMCMGVKSRYGMVSKRYTFTEPNGGFSNRSQRSMGHSFYLESDIRKNLNSIELASLPASWKRNLVRQRVTCLTPKTFTRRNGPKYEVNDFVVLPSYSMLRQDHNTPETEQENEPFHSQAYTAMRFSGGTVTRTPCIDSDHYLFDASRYSTSRAYPRRLFNACYLIRFKPNTPISGYATRLELRGFAEECVLSVWTVQDVAPASLDRSRIADILRAV